MIYKIHMSKGPDIKADSEDLEKLEQNTAAFMVKLKQGIVRPPFVISIVPTNEKEWKMHQDVKLIDGRAVVQDAKKVRVIQDVMNRNKLKRIN